MRRVLILALLGIACGGKGGPPHTPTAAAAQPREEATKARPPSGPISEPALMADVDWLCAPQMRGRGTFSQDSARAAQRIAEIFGDLGYEVVRQPVPGGSENIIAIKRAGEQAVLVSAHYDHLGVDGEGVVYPGADDNASGVAVLLALARHAANARAEKTLIFIAFGAEEPGLIGSAAYVTKPAWPLKKTHAIVNFDMVGRNFFEAGAAQPKAVAVVGLEDHALARRVAQESAQRIGFALVMAPALLVEVFGFENRTDEWWFRRQGVPAIHFSTAMHDDYHRPTDTPDKLQPSQMLGVAQIAWSVVARLAGVTMTDEQ